MASSKLTLLRNALKPDAVPRAAGAIRSVHARRFSTDSPDEQDSSSEGQVFGRLNNIGRNMLKTDAIHYFEGCGLSVDDIKVRYNQSYNPIAMLVQFPSHSSFDSAVRNIVRKGRLYNLVKIDRTEWDLQTNYAGKTVMLRPPRNAVIEDIERLFSGCNYDPSGTEFVTKQGPAGPVKLALVRFPTRTEAMSAVRRKNRSFCLNTPVAMHVLQ